MSFRSPASRKGRVKGRAGKALSTKAMMMMDVRMEVDMFSGQPPDCHIVRLPLELLLRIYSFLNVSHMRTLAQTCRALNIVPWHNIDITADPDLLQTSNTIWDFLTASVLRYLLARRPTNFILPCREKALTANTTRILDEEESSCLARLGLFHNNLTPGAQTHVLDYLTRTRPPLIELDLGDNKLSLETCRQLAEYTSKHAPTLRRLSIDGCLLDQESLIAVLQGLERHTGIRYLSLGANEIADDTARAAFSSATCPPGLEALELRVNSIGEHGSIGLAHFLSTAAALTTLDMTSNLVTDVGLKTLAPALAACSNLADLRLRRCSVGELGMAEFGAAFAAIGKAAKLSFLDVSGNYMGAAAFTQLAAELRECVNLKTIHALTNTIMFDNPEDARRLGKNLAGCPSLQVLDLSCNDLRAQCIEIMEELAKSPTLETLRLAATQISVITADNWPRFQAAIVELKVHTLDFTGNLWFPAIEISEPWRFPSTLRHLILRRCNIGDHTLHSIAKGLEVSARGLEILDLRKTCLSDIDCLLPVIQDHPSIVLLRLDGNTIKMLSCVLLGQVMSFRAHTYPTLPFALDLEQYDHVTDVDTLLQDMISFF